LQPIFNEYIQFLKDNGVDLPIEEGYYWLDNQIIKAYDTKGNLHKIARLKIDNELNITYKLFPKNFLEIEHWNDTISRNKVKLMERERESLKIIEEKLQQYKNYKPIISISDGKDSTLVEYLFKTISTKVRIVFCNTSLDCADTYKHIKSRNDVEILNPKDGFYQWIKNNIIPTRFGRGCCSIFKEGETINYFNKDEKYVFFLGMRNEESNTRSNYEDEWKNKKWGNRDWIGVLPIRKWSEEEVWLYTLWKSLYINTKYKKGYSRVGCAIACPFYSKSTWALDKYWYPKIYKRWHDILEKDFVDNYKWTKLNCTLKEYHTCWNGGLLREKPTEEVIKEFAEYKGLDIEIAKKYFNHTCKICNKNVNKSEVIAMNLKLLGRNIDTYLCKKHLMEFLEINKEQWDRYVKEFKESGCSLF
jgi:phosphoadenosine phosphosulfate reductase